MITISFAPSSGIVTQSHRLIWTQQIALLSLVPRTTLLECGNTRRSNAKLGSVRAEQHVLIIWDLYWHVCITKRCHLCKEIRVQVDIVKTNNNSRKVKSFSKCICLTRRITRIDHFQSFQLMIKTGMQRLSKFCTNVNRHAEVEQILSKCH